MQGETWGLTAREHVEALMDHGMRGLVDYVLVHTPVPLRPDSPATGGSAPSPAPTPEHASTSASATRAFRAYPPRAHQLSRRAGHPGSKGPVVIARNLVDPQRPTWHDPPALRDAFSGVLKLCRSRQR